MNKFMNTLVLLASLLLLAMLQSQLTAARSANAATATLPSSDESPRPRLIAEGQTPGPRAASPFSSSAAAPPHPSAAIAGANGKIAFASDRDGNYEIYSMNADGTEQTRLTYHPEHDVAPRWSPDGARLLFTTRRDGNFEIYSMNPDGTNQVRLTTNATDDGFPCWSPDGTKIAFVSGDVSGFTSYDNLEIYVMNADGGNRTRLTNNSVFDVLPAWSPDGARLAFVVGTVFDPDGLEIYTMNAADGGNRTRLTNNTAVDVFPAWSPDGTRLAFASGDTMSPSNAEIYVMNANGSGRTKITDNNVADGFPAWSPDGAKIVYASGSGSDGASVELFSINANGGSPTRLTNNTALDWFPDWQALAAPPPANTIGFSGANFAGDESAESATITVTRSGDKSASATVEFATVDNPAEVRCDHINVTSPGPAYARCDYATTVETLTFAAGQEEKTVAIPLINDAHIEGIETVQLVLRKPSGATLGANSSATLSLAANDSAAAPNPVFQSPFFVRMQYLDFLSREAEADGFNAWLNVLHNCPDVNNNPACDRITVSSSFFRSAEFQLKGYFVYLFYKVSLNRRPQYEEIIPDMRSVTGQTAGEVFQKRTAFADNWMLRPEFRSRYDVLPNEAYVGALLARYNLNAITTPDPSNPDGTAFVTLTRAELINRLNSQGLTRAQVLRALVQSREVDAVEYNGAFVAMQYYGYLRRAPEEAGYQNWLNYLTTHPGDFRTMIDGFMNSVEYRLRFGRS